MGYGDAGLNRARNWGRRKVTGTIVDPSTIPNIDLVAIDTKVIDISKFEKVTSITNGILPAEVLSMFADLGYIPEGRSVKDMIIEFQLDHGVIASMRDPGAGSYGPLTSSALKSEHAKLNRLRDLEMKRIERERDRLITEHTEWEVLIARAETRVDTFGNPTRGEKGDHVRNLQETLRAIGYFKGKNTGTMTPATILALKNLQKRNGLTPTGTIDPNTRVALVETLIQKGLL